MAKFGNSSMRGHMKIVFSFGLQEKKEIEGEEVNYYFSGHAIFTKKVYPGATIQVPRDFAITSGIWHVETEDEERWQLKYVEASTSSWIIWPVGNRRSKEALKISDTQLIYPGDKIQCTAHPTFGNWTLLKNKHGVLELLYEGSPNTSRCVIDRTHEHGFDRDKYTSKTNFVIHPGAEVNLTRDVVPYSGRWTVTQQHGNCCWWIRYDGPSRTLDITWPEGIIDEPEIEGLEEEDNVINFDAIGD